MLEEVEIAVSKKDDVPGSARRDVLFLFDMTTSKYKSSAEGSTTSKKAKKNHEENYGSVATIPMYVVGIRAE